MAVNPEDIFNESLDLFIKRAAEAREATLVNVMSSIVQDTTKTQEEKIKLVYETALEITFARKFIRDVLVEARRNTDAPTRP